MHGFELGMVAVERLDRPHGQQFAVDAQAIEAHRGIRETVGVEGVAVLGRHLGVCEREVAVEQRSYVVGSGVLARDRSIGHAAESTSRR
jgi:hypothetical protein